MAAELRSMRRANRATPLCLLRERSNERPLLSRASRAKRGPRFDRASKISAQRWRNQETAMIPPRVSVDVVRERIGKYADTKATAEERYAIYRDLIGFIPPRIEARINVTGALDPELLDLQEKMRARAMYPKCFDVKTSQLMLFGMLLMDMNDAAPLHGIAARRAGATWEEMQAVVSLAFLFRGLSAANRGAELLANIAKREAENDAAAKSSTPDSA